MEHSRRSFLKIGGMLIGSAVLSEVIPLGRVWSFPEEIAIPNGKLYRGREASEVGLQLEKLHDRTPLIFENNHALDLLRSSIYAPTTESNG